MHLFSICLQGMTYIEYSDHFGHVMSALLGSMVFGLEQFSVLSKQLMHGASRHRCSNYFAALRVLVTKASDDCQIYFHQLVLDLVALAEKLQVVEELSLTGSSGTGCDMRITHAQPLDKSLERRVCWDGSECTFAEFKSYYGETAERCWHMSPR